MTRTFRNPPPWEEVPRIINAADPLADRLERMKIFYDAVTDRDGEIARLDRILEKRDTEIRRLKAQVQGLEQQMRSRPKTARQLQDLVAGFERRGQVVADSHEAAQRLQGLVTELLSMLEEEVTTPN